MRKPTMPGLYIVFEGCDGVGKTTQIQLLSKTLTDAGQTVQVLQEPDAQSRLTADALYASPSNMPTNKSEILLHNAARTLSLDTIMASRDAGCVCLVERNYLSTLATHYYAQDNPTSYDTINEIIAFAVGDREPDLTIILDAPADVLVSRMTSTPVAGYARTPDMHTLEKVRAGYLIEAKRRNLPVVFTNDTPQEAFQRIWQLVLEAFSKPRAHSPAYATPPIAPPIQQLQAGSDLRSQAYPQVAPQAGPNTVIKDVSTLLLPYLTKHGVSTDIKAVNYAEKDKHGQYKYYTPSTLSKEVRTKYIEHMDILFANYGHIVKAITAHLQKTSNTADTNQSIVADKQALRIARNILPLAAKCTLSTSPSKQGLEDIVVGLLSSNSQEAKAWGRRILKQVTEQTKSDIVDSLVEYRTKSRKTVRDLAITMVSQHYGEATSPVTLTNLFPRNELDLVPYMLYEHSTRGERDIVADVTELSYTHKADTFVAYIGDRQSKKQLPGIALERAQYSWDFLCEWDVFERIRQHAASDCSWQRFTPRYGYDIPELVESAGVADTYLDSFDRSLELCSLLEQHGYDEEAQYAVMRGHKTRWKMTMNGLELIRFIEVYTSPNEPVACRALAKQMYDKLAEVHPLLSEHIIFTDKNKP